ncbi:MAG TPA: transporter substrate-binding domain-containing protein [Beijerinckiaceae bacterium]|jgi:polar amino acid transport system substrate-binding protein/arginine/ornithine transport system substrate-binding protein
MFRKFVAAAALAVAFGLPSASPALAQTKMRVGVEGSYPPFSQISPDGKLSGFDIDVANAVCAEMKVECTLVQQEFDGIIPALNAKKFDMIVASLTITEERKKAVDFSDPYYDVPSRWVAKKGAFTAATPEALKGKKIIVLRNSPREKFVKERYKESEVLSVNKETDVYLELAAGRGDIGFGSSVVSSESFLKKDQGKDYVTVGQTVRLEGGTGGVGIAVRKSDTELRDKINAALKAIKANGTYKKLQDKYFDFDISGEV